MNQVKIGKFISECRKSKNLTQMQLAEKLNITDRAVSKWERGLSLPDSSIMLDLCSELGISVNDLLSGEVVTVENYDKKLEKIGRAQRARLYKRCPRCGGKLADELVDNVISKRDGRVLVCSLCGKTEAFCDENGIADPFTDWWCFLTEDEI